MRTLIILIDRPLVLCLVIRADKRLQKLVTGQATVAMALQEIVKLRLRIIHVQLFVAIVLGVFVFVTVIVIIEVLNVLLFVG